jgi:hypothetical protein
MHISVHFQAYLINQLLALSAGERFMGRELVGYVCGLFVITR